MTRRLLSGLRGAHALDRAAHEAAYGRLDGAVSGAPLIEEVTRSGLRGRGGAGFPTGRKLAAVAGGGRRPVVVVNAAEGEPASAKDMLLIDRLPHLVLDGAVLCAGAAGAREVHVCVAEADVPALERALAERRDRVELRLRRVPQRYVAGEESALVHSLNGGPAAPTFTPPRVFSRGVAGRPTLVQNAETLAHVALIARRGADWFRELGTPQDPGTALLTVSGGVTAAGVWEIALGNSLADLLDAARPTGRIRAALVGGYFGAWIDARDAAHTPLAHDALREHGLALGCGAVIVLDDRACGLCETAAVLDYLARESAGQCGPCVHGLRAIADLLGALCAGAAPRGAVAQLRRWAGDVEGRGACHHPDGAVRLLRSALDVFATEVSEHAWGGCPTGARAGLMAVPA
jgi:NADH:ubiquinone oxidoreductase subunit F (NADH-binding)